MAERVYIYTYPRVCIKRKLTWQKDKFHMVKLLEETPYKVVLLEKNSIHCKGKSRV